MTPEGGPGLPSGNRGRPSGYYAFAPGCPDAAEKLCYTVAGDFQSNIFRG